MRRSAVVAANMQLGDGFERTGNPAYPRQPSYITEIPAALCPGLPRHNNKTTSCPLLMVAMAGAMRIGAKVTKGKTLKVYIGCKNAPELPAASVGYKARSFYDQSHQNENIDQIQQPGCARNKKLHPTTKRCNSREGGRQRSAVPFYCAYFQGRTRHVIQPETIASCGGRVSRWQGYCRQSNSRRQNCLQHCGVTRRPAKGERKQTVLSALHPVVTATGNGSPPGGGAG